MIYTWEYKADWLIHELWNMTFGPIFTHDSNINKDLNDFYADQLDFSRCCFQLVWVNFELSNQLIRSRTRNGLSLVPNHYAVQDFIGYSFPNCIKESLWLLYDNLISRLLRSTFCYYALQKDTVQIRLRCRYVVCVSDLESSENNKKYRRCWRFVPLLMKRVLGTSWFTCKSDERLVECKTAVIVIH